MDTKNDSVPQNYQAKIDELSATISQLKNKIDVLEQMKVPEDGSKQKKFLLFLASGSMDKAFVALMVANWAASVGYDCSIYCSLWSLNIIRQKNIMKNNTFLEKAAKLMMKNGPDKAILSQMHMLGMGTLFMKQLLKEHNVASLGELLQTAIDMGVNIYACETMMGIMGVTKEELFPGVKVASGMNCIQMMSDSSINLML